MNRGVTYWSEGEENRLFFVAGAWLYSLDPDTGKLVESFGHEGKVDLYEGLGREVHHLWVTAPTPGIVYDDLLILGSRVDEGPGPAAPGHVRAYDVRTGEMEWIFHTIPFPGEVGYDTWPEDAYLRTGGANSWAGFTLDRERDWVFIGATRDERFRAFDKDTGKVLWEFQLDAGAYATPASYEIDGKQYVIVAAGGGGKPETKPGDTYYCFGLP